MRRSQAARAVTAAGGHTGASAPGSTRGVAPSLVIEVTSESTRREDEQKRVLYRQIGVQEYVQYDLFGEWLRPPLQGWRLGVSGDEPMAPALHGGLVSEALGLRLVPEDGNLQLYDATTGVRLLTRAEKEAVARREAEARGAELEALVRGLQSPGTQA